MSVVKKTYFVCDTPNGPSKDFKKHAYELIPSNGRVLIHYLGNEKTASGFPHGNSKKHSYDHVRTCPSVLRELQDKCETSTTAKVYRNSITKLTPTTHLPVMQPRISQQVENIRNKQIRQNRISHDALYNLHEIAFDMPEFVYKIETHPDLLRICGAQTILQEFEKVLLLKSPSAQLLSYDTTFKLGDFYLSAFVFRHTLFQENPVIPALFVLHERKFQQCHEQLFTEAVKHVPALRTTKHPMVTDEEKGINNAIVSKLPLVNRVRCWNHLYQDAKVWLRSHGAPAEDINQYKTDLELLFQQPTLKEYSDLLAEKTKKWSAPFTDYYKSNLHVNISSIGRWSLEKLGIYNPYSGITSNQSESFNCLLKHLNDWKESPVDCMILAL